MEAHHGSSLRDGFTLIEVVIALVLLASVLVMLAGMTFATAQRSVDLQSAGARQALVLEQVNRMSAMAYDSLPGTVGCTTITAADGDEYEECVTLVTLNSNSRRVQVVLDPARTGVPSDTVRLIRSRPPAGNPLDCGGC
ncbi:MAG: type IV pilus modification PilV family protein [Longimicrobiales bacterium]